MRQGLAGQHHAADDIHVEGLAEHFFGVVGHGLPVHVACIVHEHIQLTAMRYRRGHHLFAVRSVGHIAHHRMAERANGGCHSLYFFRPTPGNGDVSTTRSEQPRDGFTQAGATAGNEHRHSVNITHAFKFQSK